MQTRIQGNLVDIHSHTIFPADISIEGNTIKGIKRSNEAYDRFIVPGFVDAHVHIESSLLIPEKFAAVALRHGTVATVSDPHEIANVCGIAGVNFMIQSGENSKLKFFWTAPSCVPATSFETSGASLGVNEVANLMANPNIVALGEMMNFPGVVSNDDGVMEKIATSLSFGKPVDGHAPALDSDELMSYVRAGISTDHECATLEEALEKINLGMKIQIREGSSAKNFEALFPLIVSHPDRVMLCSDDLHADDLLKGHVNLLVKRAIRVGVPLFNVLQAVSQNPVLHYNLPVGLLRVNDRADFLIVDNLTDFNILETWIDGELVYESNENSTILGINPTHGINNFNSSLISTHDLEIKVKSGKVKVICVEEGSLLTNQVILPVGNNFELFLRSNNVLRLFVKDRYGDSKPSFGLVRGFGPMKGAIASTIAHDSHNLVAIGDNVSDIAKAMNLLVGCRGGICFVSDEHSEVLPLPVAGLMSGSDAELVANHYAKIISLAGKHGCILSSPLMTLSFLALLVIPSLKLSDKGLFDVDTFSFTDLFV